LAVSTVLLPDPPDIDGGAWTCKTIAIRHIERLILESVALDNPALEEPRLDHPEKAVTIADLLKIGNQWPQGRVLGHQV
jgi:hypothetical protein